MPTSSNPVEALFVFTPTGELKGGHTVRRDPTTGLPGLPLPLGEDQQFSFAHVLEEINTASLATIAQLQQSLKDALEQIAQLETSQSVSTSASSLLSDLDSKFEEFVPEAARPNFAAPYAIVRVLVQADKIDLARAVIEGVAVPPELAEAKQNLLSLF